MIDKQTSEQEDLSKRQLEEQRQLERKLERDLSEDSSQSDEKIELQKKLVGQKFTQSQTEEYGPPRRRV